VVIAGFSSVPARRRSGAKSGLDRDYEETMIEPQSMGA